MAVCEIQRALEGATNAPPSETGQIDAPGLAALTSQRPPVFYPELATMSELAMASDLASSAMTTLPVDSLHDSRSGPPESRYLFLLTPHAPPITV